MASIRKIGNRWYVRWREYGRQFERAVGTKRLAEQVAAQIQARVTEGELVGHFREKRITFSEFAPIYQERHGANQAPTTRRRDDDALKRLTPVFGRHLLQAIQAEDIERYKAIRSKDVAPATVNKEITVLKAMLNRAVDWGYLRVSPASKVKKFKVPEKQCRVLTLDEVYQLLDVARGHMKTFIALAVFTGMRKSRIHALQWKDVNLERREILTYNSKGMRDQVIPINEELLKILRGHPRHISSPYVIHNSDGSPWIDTRGRFNTTVKRAGLPFMRIHDLKHTFVTALFSETTLDPRHIQELAGHRDIRTTMRYAHVRETRLREGVEGLNRPRRRDENDSSVEAG